MWQLQIDSQAMEMLVVDEIVTLSVSVVEGDFIKFQEARAKPTEISTIALKNSYGGDALSGYQIGQLIRKQGLPNKALDLGVITELSIWHRPATR
jgi:hypothetical protein